MSNRESNRFTRECLQTALICLMAEKPFDKITVSELVRRSGVSRTAFYRNYKAKEDILKEVHDMFFQNLADSFSDSKYQENSRLWYHDFYTLVQENAGTFRLLYQANLTNGPLFKGISLELELERPISTREHYKILAWQSAFLSVLTDWFKNGMKESPDDMAGLCSELLDRIW